MVIKLNQQVKIKKGSKNKYEGLVGKVICFAKNLEQSIGVEFENKIEQGHDFVGKEGKKGHCYYFNSRELTNA